jgi:hypothetical protein
MTHMRREGGMRADDALVVEGCTGKMEEEERMQCAAEVGEKERRRRGQVGRGRGQVGRQLQCLVYAYSCP